MKKLILLSGLLLVLTIAQSQEPSVTHLEVNSEGNVVVTKTRLIDLEFPFHLQFHPNLKDSAIGFKNEDGSATVALGGFKIGQDGWGESSDADGNTLSHPYKLSVSESGELNPSKDNNEKLAEKKYQLHIGGQSLPLTVNPAQSEAAAVPSEINSSSGNEEYKAGYLYYDAMELTRSELTPAEKITFLKDVYSVDKNTDNAYLTDFFAIGVNQSATARFQNTISGIGNTDVTNIAGGFARFLAERAKEELNAAFFNKMKKQLDAYPELKTIFPKTAKAMGVIETYAYSSILNVLKHAFESDMQNFPKHLYNLSNIDAKECTVDGDKNSKCEQRIAALNTFFSSMNGRWTKLSLSLVKDFSKASSPDDLLLDITRHSQDFNDLKAALTDAEEYGQLNILASLELCNLLSQSLLSKEETEVWISPRQMSELFNTPKAFKYFLGLMQARAAHLDDEHKIIFYNEKNESNELSKILENNFEKYEEFTSIIRNVQQAFDQTNTAVGRINELLKSGGELPTGELYTMYQNVTASLDPVLNDENLKSILGGVDLNAAYTQVLKFIDPAVDLVYDISVKNMSSAIFDAVQILEALESQKYKPDSCKSREKSFRPVLQSFIKYGTFIGTVAEAESSDDVKKAIESTVLPAGSYSIKRNSKWSNSINAYVGYGFTNRYDKDTVEVHEFNAPVGWNISRGLQTGKGKSLGAFSANVQLFDLGALVNYYTVEGDTASMPVDFSVKLSNVFSPGFTVGYNIPKTPIFLAWGRSFIPTRFEFEEQTSGLNLVKKNAWRNQFTILIDIPLFNLGVKDFY